MCMRSEVLTAVPIQESCFVCDCVCSSEWLLTFRGIVADSPSGSSTPLILGLRNPQVNITDISPAVWTNTCEHLTFDYVYVRARACVFLCARIEKLQSAAANCSMKNRHTYRTESISIVRT